MLGICRQEEEEMTGIELLLLMLGLVKLVTPPPPMLGKLEVVTVIADVCVTQGAV